MYYGSDRKGSRNKNLNKLFKNDENLNKIWIGYDPGYEKTINLQCPNDIFIRV